MRMREVARMHDLCTHLSWRLPAPLLALNQMPIRIRLALHGCTNRPFYHIVVAPSKAPRNGRHLEQVIRRGTVLVCLSGRGMVMHYYTQMSMWRQQDVCYVTEWYKLIIGGLVFVCGLSSQSYFAPHTENTTSLQDYSLPLPSLCMCLCVASRLLRLGSRDKQGNCRGSCELSSRAGNSGSFVCK